MIFSVSQNYCLTQIILCLESRRYGDVFYSFFISFLQIKDNNTPCPHGLSLCSIAGNQLTCLECAIFPCSRFLFFILYRKNCFQYSTGGTSMGSLSQLSDTILSVTLIGQCTKEFQPSLCSQVGVKRYFKTKNRHFIIIRLIVNTSNW